MSTTAGCDYLLKGYSESQCFLLRIGGMYVLQNKNQMLNWVYVVFFHLTYYIFIFWIVPLDLSYTIPMGNLEATFQAIHYTYTMLGYSVTSYLYLINRRSVNYTLIAIGKGFFSYTDEDDNETELVKTKMKEYLKKLTKRFIVIASATVSGVVFVPPIIEVLTRSDPIPDDEIINPYLPLPLVLPWDTFHWAGYLLTYVLILMVSYCILTELLALSMGYTSFMIIYISQFKILNESISKIEERATKRYENIYGKSTKGMSKLNKFKISNFQESMIYCLRENIMHHQILLQWMKQATKFLGWSLLDVFLTTSLLLAASGYLATVEKSSIFKTLILVQVQILELLYAYLFCWWGENLSTESGKLTESLYGVPWFHCNKKFNKMLQIMICNSAKPVVPKSPIFNIEATLEFYKSIISTGYSYFNLLRSMN